MTLDICSKPAPYYFNTYHDPQHLHSFPTRRSSDLADCAAREGCLLQRRDRDKDSGVDEAARRADGRGRPRRVLDRKSTRLNSSHVEISYAVFCLKKKKNSYYYF